MDEQDIGDIVKRDLSRYDAKMERAGQRVRDKSDRATVEQVLDARTLRVIGKLQNAGYFSGMHGCISTGKEANVYYCSWEKNEKQPDMCQANGVAMKVFKTSILVFKDRDRYVTGEFRFRNGYSHNPRKMVKMWAEKEFRNLLRMKKGGLPVPQPIAVKSHVLLMEFMGCDGWPAPRLRDAKMSGDVAVRIYRDLCRYMRIMYQECRLVHADLSEYNMLVHREQLYIIDVSQSVEHDHPHALAFLRMDCLNCTKFFRKAGIPCLRVADLFAFITDAAIKAKDVEQWLNEMEERVRAEPPMTDEEVAEEEVFQKVFIPRTLDEVYDFERDFEVVQAGGKVNYATVTGLKQDLSGAQPDYSEDESEDESSSVEKVWEERPEKKTKEQIRAERKANKTTVKAERQEKIKTKTPKHVKKRQQKLRKRRNGGK